MSQIGIEVIMKIGLAQIDCDPGNVKSNISKFETFAKQAKDKGCNVVIFPEMSDTGYVTSIIPECAQPWPGLSFEAARVAAASNSIHIFCGLSEKKEDSTYNSLAHFDPDGKLQAHYRKLHLFTPAPVFENKFIQQGNELSIAKVDGTKWGLSICYDLRFPELYRSQTLEGSEILLICSAWPNVRPSHWDHLSRSRAIENQTFLIGVDRVGTDGDITFNGQSRIVNPMGEILVEGSSTSEELIVGEIDMTKISEARNAIPINTSRRSDIYGDLKST